MNGEHIPEVADRLAEMAKELRWLSKRIDCDLAVGFRNGLYEVRAGDGDKHAAVRFDPTQEEMAKESMRPFMVSAKIGPMLMKLHHDLEYAGRPFQLDDLVVPHSTPWDGDFKPAQRVMRNTHLGHKGVVTRLSNRADARVTVRFIGGDVAVYHEEELRLQRAENTETPPTE